MSWLLALGWLLAVASTCAACCVLWLSDNSFFAQSSSRRYRDAIKPSFRPVLCSAHPRPADAGTPSHCAFHRFPGHCGSRLFSLPSILAAVAVAAPCHYILWLARTTSIRNTETPNAEHLAAPDLAGRRPLVAETYPSIQQLVVVKFRQTPSTYHLSSYTHLRTPSSQLSDSPSKQLCHNNLRPQQPLPIRPPLKPYPPLADPPPRRISTDSQTAMAGKAPSHVIPASISFAPATSPDSDVSPGTKPAPKPTDYFETDPAAVHNAASRGANQKLRVDSSLSGGTSTGPSTATSTSTIGLDGSTDSRRPSYNGSDQPVISRKSSSASVVFRSPRNPSLPQGLPRKTDNKRLRESSPEPIK